MAGKRTRQHSTAPHFLLVNLFKGTNLIFERNIPLILRGTCFALPIPTTNPRTVRILGDLPDGSFIVVSPGADFAAVCEKLRIEREPLIAHLASKGLRIVLSDWISDCLDRSSKRRADEPVDFSLTNEWQVLPVSPAPAPLRAAKGKGDSLPRPPSGAGVATAEAHSSKHGTALCVAGAVTAAAVVAAMSSSAAPALHSWLAVDPAPVPASKAVCEVRALFCGSREWTDRRAIEDAIKSLPAGSVVIHGNAAGVDKIAGELAASHGLQVLVFEADWELYGRSAGVRRNSDMLLEGKPTCAYAFQIAESRGTADMVRKISAAGLLLWHIRR